MSATAQQGRTPLNSNRRRGGKQAQINGRATEAAFEATAKRYEHEELLKWLKTGAPVAKGANGFRAADKGPPDYQIDLLLDDGLPPRSIWIEVKSQTHKIGQGMRADHKLVKGHQRRFMLERLAVGVPTLVLVKVEQIADWDKTPPRMAEHKGGWWLIPICWWGDGTNSESLTLADLDERGARCPDLWAPGEPATAKSQPDWLGALRVLDARDDCPWLPIWGGE